MRLELVKAITKSLIEDLLDDLTKESIENIKDNSRRGDCKKDIVDRVHMNFTDENEDEFKDAIEASYRLLEASGIIFVEPEEGPERTTITMEGCSRILDLYRFGVSE